MDQFLGLCGERNKELQEDEPYAVDVNATLWLYGFSGAAPVTCRSVSHPSIVTSSPMVSNVISHQTKVSNLDDTISGEENVGGLQISVNKA